MRKHDVRKWLHAILDLLPVIIIPVFMIYSHRHQIDSYTIDVPQNEIVQVNQYVVNGKPNNLTDWSYYGNVDFEVYQNEFLLLSNNSSDDFALFGDILQDYDIGDSILFSMDIDINTCAEYQVGLTDSEDEIEYLSFYDETTFSFNGRLQKVITIDSDSYKYIDFYIVFSESVTDASFSNIQIFNLTKMFGSGNEPTIDEFNAYFPKDYYAVDSTAKALVKNVGTITYNDTDIGSQMLYCLYNSVDKYFNLNNVFGFNNVYDWLSLNIFNGNPPIAIYIVWNIALYEFLMDLIMLLYALFMWFIDMCEHLIDRSFGVASGRKK